MTCVYCSFRFKDHSSSGSESDSDAEEATQSHCSKALKPVVCMGWQPDSNVFVLGEALHFRDDGERIPPDEQECIYIPFILEKLGLSNSISPINTLPDIQNPLYTVMDGIGQVAGDNRICALFCLGMHVTTDCSNRLLHVI